MHAAVPRGIEKVGEGILPEVREFIRDTNLEHTFFTGSMQVLFGSFQKRPTDSVFSARSRRPGGALSKKSIPILRLPPTFTTSPYKNNRGGQVAHTRTKRRSARLRVQHALPYCRTGGGGGGGRRRQAAEEARRRRQRGGGAAAALSLVVRLKYPPWTVRSLRERARRRERGRLRADAACLGKRDHRLTSTCLRPHSSTTLSSRPMLAGSKRLGDSPSPRLASTRHTCQTRHTLQ